MWGSPVSNLIPTWFRIHCCAYDFISLTDPLDYAAIQLAKMSGFDPIITTSSSHNIPYCKAAGATHVIDYHTTPYGPAFVKAVSSITNSPVKVIFDCVSDSSSQRASWSILAPGGKLILALPSSSVGTPGVEGKDGKRVVTPYGSVYNDEVGGDTRLGKSMFASLENMMRDGDIKPSRVELLPRGLNGVADGMRKLMAHKVSGGKLVARIGDTPQ